MDSKEDILQLFSGGTENNKSQLDLFLEKMASEDENTSEEENMKGLRDDLNDMSLAEVLETLNSVAGEKEAETEEDEMSEEQAYDVLSNVTASELIHAVSDSDEMAKEAEEEFGDVDLTQFSALEFLEALGENAEGDEKTAEDDTYNEFYNMGRAYMEGAMSTIEDQEKEASLSSKAKALAQIANRSRAVTNRGAAAAEKAVGKASAGRSGGKVMSARQTGRATRTSLEDVIRRVARENPRAFGGTAAGLGIAGAGAGGYAAGRRTKKAEETLDDLTLDDISGAELLELLDEYNG